MKLVQYALVTLIAVLFTWLIHEFAHWGTGELLGNDMIMTLNTCYPTTGMYAGSWHDSVISAAGPLITLGQAIVFYLLLKRNSSVLLFPFLLTCFYTRFLASVMNFISLNDEGRISSDLGLGVFTLPLLASGVLFYLSYDTIKGKGFKTTLIVQTVLWIMLFSSILILTDQAFKIRLL